MKRERIYLDHNATTPVAEEARAAMVAALAVWGNPSSIHGEGRAARELVEAGRRRVAALIGGMAEDIVFTSGGTEADCLGVVGLARLGRARGRPPRLLTTAIEHPAVRGAARALAEQGFAVVELAVDAHGRIDLGELEREARRGAAAMAVSLANHELGTVQDVPAIAALAAAHAVFVHCDAVQAAGKIPIRVAELGADSVAISAHKIYGPKGTGALWIRRGLDLGPLIPAGHQERERRPGTENVVGIAGMGEAARLAGERLDQDGEAMRSTARLLEDGLARQDRVRIHGSGAPRVGNTVNAGIAGALGEAVVAALDLAGVAASTGAACTSGSVAPSPVLLGIGLSPEHAVEAVRFSVGRGTTAEDIHVVLDVLPDIIARARRFR